MPGAVNGWTVYAIDLKKSVLKNRKFLRANPQYRVGKPCVYVGVTFRSAEERFKQHMNGIHAASIVLKCGKRVRHRDCRCLRPTTRARAEKKAAAYAPPQGTWLGRLVQLRDSRQS